MRKRDKQGLLELIRTVYNAHDEIKKLLKLGDTRAASGLIADCQESLLNIGEVIIQSEGEQFVTIGLVEDYCREIFNIYNSVSDITDFESVRKTLNRMLTDIKKSIDRDVVERKEIVFMPYKASMWDSLESVWKAADADPECDAYVVPIPYYDRNPDHSFGEFHYEGGDYPDYVPVTHYNNYDISKRRPDVIYIHNPYDDCNYVTSVDPRYYSIELKKYTDELVYIPYFVLAEPDPNDTNSVESVAHFAITPGVVNADKVIVQSEAMKQTYIKALLNKFGDTAENRNILENKILGMGSPKFDKLNDNSVDLYIPAEWSNHIFTKDGKRKKVVFYNTGVSMFLQFNNRMLRKIESVFQDFAKQKDNIVLLWRPHPLLKTTIKSMRPQLLSDYERILRVFKESDIGILDESTDLERAIKISDVYFGDISSVVELFSKQNKPVLFQRMFNFIYNESEDTVSLLDRYCYNSDNENVWFIDVESHWLYKIIQNNNGERTASSIAPIPENINGIVTGLRNNKLFIFPYADNVNFYLVYDISKNIFKKETIDYNFHGLNFVTSSYICGNYYYTLYRDMVLKIDADSGKITKKYSIDVQLTDYGMRYANTFVSDKLYFSYYPQSVLYCFDTNTAKTEKFPLNVDDIVSMCSDDNNVYMMDSLHTICVWNQNNHELFTTVISDDDTGCYYLDEKSELVFDTQFKKNFVDCYFPSYVSISTEDYVFFTPYCMNKMVILRKNDFSVMTVPLMDEDSDYVNDSPVRYIFEYNTDEKIYLIKVGTNDHLEFDMNTFTLKKISLNVNKKDYFNSLSNIRYNKINQSSYSRLNELEILNVLCNTNDNCSNTDINRKNGLAIHSNIVKRVSI